MFTKDRLSADTSDNLIDYNHMKGIKTSQDIGCTSYPALSKPVSKYNLLHSYFECNVSADSSKMIAQEFKRQIKSCNKDPIFIDELRNKIIYLHNYNKKVAEISMTYPFSKELSELLLQYVLIESKTLYRRQHYTGRNEIKAQDRILRLLLHIYNAYFESKLVPAKKVFEKSAKAIINMFIEIRSDYGLNNALLENMTKILLKKMGHLEKIEALKGKRLPCPLDTCQKNDLISEIYRNTITSDYGTDDCSSNGFQMDDESDDVQIVTETADSSKETDETNKEGEHPLSTDHISPALIKPILTICLDYCGPGSDEEFVCITEEVKTTVEQEKKAVERTRRIRQIQEENKKKTRQRLDRIQGEFRARKHKPMEDVKCGDKNINLSDKDITFFRPLMITEGLPEQVNPSKAICESETFEISDEDECVEFITSIQCSSSNGIKDCSNNVFCIEITDDEDVGDTDDIVAKKEDEKVSTDKNIEPVEHQTEQHPNQENLDISSKITCNDEHLQTISKPNELAGSSVIEITDETVSDEEIEKEIDEKVSQLSRKSSREGTQEQSVVSNIIPKDGHPQLSTLECKESTTHETVLSTISQDHVETQALSTLRTKDKIEENESTVELKESSTREETSSIVSQDNASSRFVRISDLRMIDKLKEHDEEYSGKPDNNNKIERSISSVEQETNSMKYEETATSEEKVEAISEIKGISTLEIKNQIKENHNELPTLPVNENKNAESAVSMDQLEMFSLTIDDTSQLSTMETKESITGEATPTISRDHVEALSEIKRIESTKIEGKIRDKDHSITNTSEDTCQLSTLESKEYPYRVESPNISKDQVGVSSKIKDNLEEYDDDDDVPSIPPGNESKGVKEQTISTISHGVAASSKIEGINSDDKKECPSMLDHDDIIETSALLENQSGNIDLTRGDTCQLSSVELDQVGESSEIQAISALGFKDNFEEHTEETIPDNEDKIEKSTMSDQPNNIIMKDEESSKMKGISAFDIKDKIEAKNYESPAILHKDMYQSSTMASEEYVVREEATSTISQEQVELSFENKGVAAARIEHQFVVNDDEAPVLPKNSNIIEAQYLSVELETSSTCEEVSSTISQDQIEDSSETLFISGNKQDIFKAIQENDVLESSLPSTDIIGRLDNESGVEECETNTETSLDLSIDVCQNPTEIEISMETISEEQVVTQEFHIEDSSITTLGGISDDIDCIPAGHEQIDQEIEKGTPSQTSQNETNDLKLQNFISDDRFENISVSGEPVDEIFVSEDPVSETPVEDIPFPVSHVEVEHSFVYQDPLDTVIEDSSNCVKSPAFPEIQAISALEIKDKLAEYDASAIPGNKSKIEKPSFSTDQTEIINIKNGIKDTVVENELTAIPDNENKTEIHVSNNYQSENLTSEDVSQLSIIGVKESLFCGQATSKESYAVEASSDIKGISLEDEKESLPILDNDNIIETSALLKDQSENINLTTEETCQLSSVEFETSPTISQNQVEESSEIQAISDSRIKDNFEEDPEGTKPDDDNKIEESTISDQPDDINLRNEESLKIKGISAFDVNDKNEANIYAIPDKCTSQLSTTASEEYVVREEATSTFSQDHIELSFENKRVAAARIENQFEVNDEESPVLPKNSNIIEAQYLSVELETSSTCEEVSSTIFQDQIENSAETLLISGNNQDIFKGRQDNESSNGLPSNNIIGRLETESVVEEYETYTETPLDLSIDDHQNQTEIEISMETISEEQVVTEEIPTDDSFITNEFQTLTLGGTSEIQDDSYVIEENVVDDINCIPAGYKQIHGETSQSETNDSKLQHFIPDDRFENISVSGEPVDEIPVSEEPASETPVEDIPFPVSHVEVEHSFVYQDSPNAVIEENQSLTGDYVDISGTNVEETNESLHISTAEYTFGDALINEVEIVSCYEDHLVEIDKEFKEKPEATEIVNDVNTKEDSPQKLQEFMVTRVTDAPALMKNDPCVKSISHLYDRPEIDKLIKKYTNICGRNNHPMEKITRNKRKPRKSGNAAFYDVSPSLKPLDLSTPQIVIKKNTVENNETPIIRSLDYQNNEIVDNVNLHSQEIGVTTEDFSISGASNMLLLASTAVEVSKEHYEKSHKAEPKKTTKSGRKQLTKKFNSSNKEVNKRVTRSQTTKPQDPSSFSPTDVLSMKSYSPTTNKIYTQKLSEIPLTSEESNDSESNRLMIDEDVYSKSGAKNQAEAGRVKENKENSEPREEISKTFDIQGEANTFDDTLDENLQFFIRSKTAVPATNLETEDNSSQLPIAEQQLQFSFNSLDDSNKKLNKPRFKTPGQRKLYSTDVPNNTADNDDNNEEVQNIMLLNNSESRELGEGYVTKNLQRFDEKRVYDVDDLPLAERIKKGTNCKESKKSENTETSGLKLFDSSSNVTNSSNDHISGPIEKKTVQDEQGASEIKNYYILPKLRDKESLRRLSSSQVDNFSLINETTSSPDRKNLQHPKLRVKSSSTNVKDIKDEAEKLIWKSKINTVSPTTDKLMKKLSFSIDAGVDNTSDLSSMGILVETNTEESNEGVKVFIADKDTNKNASPPVEVGATLEVFTSNESNLDGNKVDLKSDIGQAKSDFISFPLAIEEHKLINDIIITPKRKRGGRRKIVHIRQPASQKKSVDSTKLIAHKDNQFRKRVEELEQGSKIIIENDSENLQSSIPVDESETGTAKEIVLENIERVQLVDSNDQLTKKNELENTVKYDEELSVLNESDPGEKDDTTEKKKQDMVNKSKNNSRTKSRTRSQSHTDENNIIEVEEKIRSKSTKKVDNKSKSKKLRLDSNEAADEATEKVSSTSKNVSKSSNGSLDIKQLKSEQDKEEQKSREKKQVIKSKSKNEEKLRKDDLKNINEDIELKNEMKEEKSSRRKYRAPSRLTFTDEKNIETRTGEKKRDPVQDGKNNSKSSGRKRLNSNSSSKRVEILIGTEELNKVSSSSTNCKSRRNSIEKKVTEDKEKSCFRPKTPETESYGNNNAVHAEANASSNTRLKRTVETSDHQRRKSKPDSIGNKNDNKKTEDKDRGGRKIDDDTLIKETLEYDLRENKRRKSGSCSIKTGDIQQASLKKELKNKKDTQKLEDLKRTHTRDSGKSRKNRSNKNKLSEKRESLSNIHENKEKSTLHPISKLAALNLLTYNMETVSSIQSEELSKLENPQFSICKPIEKKNRVLSVKLIQSCFDTPLSRKYPKSTKKIKKYEESFETLEKELLDIISIKEKAKSVVDKNLESKRETSALKISEDEGIIETASSSINITMEKTSETESCDKGELEDLSSSSRADDQKRTRKVEHSNSTAEDSGFENETKISSSYLENDTICEIEKLPAEINEIESETSNVFEISEGIVCNEETQISMCSTNPTKIGKTSENISQEINSDIDSSNIQTEVEMANMPADINLPSLGNVKTVDKSPEDGTKALYSIPDLDAEKQHETDKYCSLVAEKNISDNENIKKTFVESTNERNIRSSSNCDDPIMIENVIVDIKNGTHDSETIEEEKFDDSDVHLKASSLSDCNSIEKKNIEDYVHEESSADSLVVEEEITEIIKNEINTSTDSSNQNDEIPMINDTIEQCEDSRSGYDHNEEKTLQSGSSIDNNRKRKLAVKTKASDTVNKNYIIPCSIDITRIEVMSERKGVDNLHTNFQGDNKRESEQISMIINSPASTEKVISELNNDDLRPGINIHSQESEKSDLKKIPFKKNIEIISSSVDSTLIEPAKLVIDNMSDATGEVVEKLRDSNNMSMNEPILQSEHREKKELQEYESCTKVYEESSEITLATEKSSKVRNLPVQSNENSKIRSRSMENLNDLCEVKPKKLKICSKVSVDSDDPLWVENEAIITELSGDEVVKIPADSPITPDFNTPDENTKTVDPSTPNFGIDVPNESESHYEHGNRSYSSEENCENSIDCRTLAKSKETEVRHEESSETTQMESFDVIYQENNVISNDKQEDSETSNISCKPLKSIVDEIKIGESITQIGNILEPESVLKEAAAKTITVDDSTILLSTIVNQNKGAIIREECDYFDSKIMISENTTKQNNSSTPECSLILDNIEDSCQTPKQFHVDYLAENLTNDPNRSDKLNDTVETTEDDNASVDAKIPTVEDITNGLDSNRNGKIEKSLGENVKPKENLDAFDNMEEEKLKVTECGTGIYDDFQRIPLDAVTEGTVVYTDANVMSVEELVGPAISPRCSTSSIPYENREMDSMECLLNQSKEEKEIVCGEAFVESESTVDFSQLRDKDNLFTTLSSISAESATVRPDPQQLKDRFFPIHSVANEQVTDDAVTTHENLRMEIGHSTSSCPLEPKEEIITFEIPEIESQVIISSDESSRHQSKTGLLPYVYPSASDSMPLRQLETYDTSLSDCFSCIPSNLSDTCISISHNDDFLQTSGVHHSSMNQGDLSLISGNAATQNILSITSTGTATKDIPLDAVCDRQQMNREQILTSSGFRVSEYQNEIGALPESYHSLPVNDEEDHTYSSADPVIGGSIDGEDNYITKSYTETTAELPPNDNPLSLEFRDLILDEYKLNEFNESTIKNLSMIATNFKEYDIFEESRDKEELDITTESSINSFQTRPWQQIIENDNNPRKVLVVPNDQCSTPLFTMSHSDIFNSFKASDYCGSESTAKSDGIDIEKPSFTSDSSMKSPEKKIIDKTDENPKNNNSSAVKLEKPVKIQKRENCQKPAQEVLPTRKYSRTCPAKWIRNTNSQSVSTQKTPTQIKKETSIEVTSPTVGISTDNLLKLPLTKAVDIEPVVAKSHTDPAPLSILNSSILPKPSPLISDFSNSVPSYPKKITPSLCKKQEYPNSIPSEKINTNSSIQSSILNNIMRPTNPSPTNSRNIKHVLATRPKSSESPEETSRKPQSNTIDPAKTKTEEAASKVELNVEKMDIVDIVKFRKRVATNLYSACVDFKRSSKPPNSKRKKTPPSSSSLKSATSSQPVVKTYLCQDGPVTVTTESENPLRIRLKVGEASAKPNPPSGAKQSSDYSIDNILSTPDRGSVGTKRPSSGTDGKPAKVRKVEGSRTSSGDDLFDRLKDEGSVNVLFHNKTSRFYDQKARSASRTKDVPLLARNDSAFGGTNRGDKQKGTPRDSKSRSSGNYREYPYSGHTSARSDSHYYSRPDPARTSGVNRPTPRPTHYPGHNPSHPANAHKGHSQQYPARSDSFRSYPRGDPIPATAVPSTSQSSRPRKNLANQSTGKQPEQARFPDNGVSKLPKEKVADLLDSIKTTVQNHLKFGSGRTSEGEQHDWIKKINMRVDSSVLEPTRGMTPQYAPRRDFSGQK